MEIEYLEKLKYPTSAMFNITDDCNLACKYCFVQQKPNYITLNTAKQAVDFLENNYNIKKKNNWLLQGEKIFITFFGGEPTLLFDQIIIPLIEYIECNKDYSQFKFAMTTNCTLLNEDRLKFLKKHNFGLLWSIDGDKETQDYNRPCKNNCISSFELVSKNIPLMLKYFPEITFRSTIYKDTVHLLYENYLFAKKQGFLNYCAMPDTRSKNWTEADLQTLEKQINLICLDQLKEYINQNGNRFINFDNLFKSLKLIPKHDLFTGYVSSKGIQTQKNTIYRCGLGTTGISINFNGDIFSCQEQDSREHGEYFYIGNIYSGIDVEKHKKILNDYINSDIVCEKKDFCNSCYLENICTKGCPSTQKDMFNNMGQLAFVRCYYDNLIMSNAILLFKILTEKKKTFLMDIIDNTLNSLPFAIYENNIDNDDLN